MVLYTLAYTRTSITVIRTSVSLCLYKDSPAYIYK